MKLETLAPIWQRIRLTDTTTNTFPTIGPTKAIGANGADSRPSGKGDAAANTTRSVFSLMGNDEARSGGSAVQNCIKVMLYGTDANNETVAARFYVWSLLIELGDMDTAVWIPTLLCEVTGTLSSTIVGVSGGIVNASQMFCDTLAIVGTSGNDDVSIDIVSPANDTPAHIVMDFKGGQLFEPVLEIGTGASANGLWAGF